MNTNSRGILYIVATPIGNLLDISLRAIEVLKGVDWIAAEDTRHSAVLLQHFAIATPIMSLHEHNEREHIEKIIHFLKEGKSLALISDAGTPLISDPGYSLVKAARLEGAKIVPIPGSCAAIAALSTAGLPTDRFVFEGFLPAKSKARMDRLSFLKNEMRTLIFYEAPHRIMDFLQDMRDSLGDERTVVIARELTKKFETIYSGTLPELIDRATRDSHMQRGEMVVVVEGAKASEPDSHAAFEILALLLEELPVKKAAEIAAKITGGRKNELYKQALNYNAKRSQAKKSE